MTYNGLIRPKVNYRDGRLRVAHIDEHNAMISVLLLDEVFELLNVLFRVLHCYCSGLRD